MSQRAKKILATAFATLVGVVALAVQMEVVSGDNLKYAMFAVAALSLINTLFLPAVVGESVSVPSVGKRGGLFVLGLFGLTSLAGCDCWQVSSPKYTTPGCLLARGIVDCAKDVTSAAFQSALSQVDAITHGAQSDDVKQALLSDLEAQGGSAALCAMAAVAETLLSRKFATPSGPPVVKTYLRSKHTGQVVVGLPDNKSLTIR